MKSGFEQIPFRIFLDSSTLQTIQDYGGYFFENEPLAAEDPIANFGEIAQQYGACRTFGGEKRW